ncbi:hypothetical protein DMUE_4330 [Dictyocoela muelleri]|nr:hypothetical protein DMUE_4330 [Dictyocoela muelleri]
MIIDFENASHKSLKEIFPNTQQHGCNFHFGQIMWRYVQKSGFSKLYLSSLLFKMHIKMILALSSVPEEEVECEASKLSLYFKEINAAEAQSILLWFSSQYIKNIHRGFTNRNIHFLNVYKRSLIGIPRTTNSLEGFHRHLNVLITIKQQSIIKIGGELIKEQTMRDNYLLHSLNINNNTIVNEGKIIIVVEKYQDYYHIEYLKAIALNFSWKLNYFFLKFFIIFF